MSAEWWVTVAVVYSIVTAVTTCLWLKERKARIATEGELKRRINMYPPYLRSLKEAMQEEGVERYYPPKEPTHKRGRGKHV